MNKTMPVVALGDKCSTNREREASIPLFLQHHNVQYYIIHLTGIGGQHSFLYSAYSAAAHSPLSFTITFGATTREQCVRLEGYYPSNGDGLVKEAKHNVLLMRCRYWQNKLNRRERKNSTH